MRGRLLSTNPDKAWAELVFLAGSPVWIAAVAVVLLSGWIHTWRDPGYVVFSLVAVAPAVAGPMLLHHRFADGRRWTEAYWLKLNIWVGIVVFFGTYFGTHYFFDLMGMHYGFPVTWMFQAEVVGRRGGEVPVFMYPLTQAYFVTYFVSLQVALRWAQSRFDLGKVGSFVILLGLAYVVAFAETFFMATPHVEPYFSYADRGRMLAVGSFGYAVYFVIGLPLLRPIDEGQPWPLRRVVLRALATCMLILCGLEAWALLVGPL